MCCHVIEFFPSSNINCNLNVVSKYACSNPPCRFSYLYVTRARAYTRTRTHPSLREWLGKTCFPNMAVLGTSWDRPPIHIRSEMCSEPLLTCKLLLQRWDHNSFTVTPSEVSTYRTFPLPFSPSPEKLSIWCWLEIFAFQKEKWAMKRCLLSWDDLLLVHSQTERQGSCPRQCLPPRLLHVSPPRPLPSPPGWLRGLSSHLGIQADGRAGYRQDH